MDFSKLQYTTIAKIDLLEEFRAAKVSSSRTIKHEK